MIFQIRTVPGQTLSSVRADVLRLLDEIRRTPRAWTPRSPIPANGPEDGWFQDPMEVSRGHPLVTALAEGHRLAAGARRW